MGRENPVSRILVTSGDQALLAAGSRMDALAVGQLGIFNIHTGLSVDGSVPANAKDIQLAVGVNRSGGGTIEDIETSAGQVIQVRNVTGYTAKPYISPLPKIVEISGFTAKCETSYAIKMEFRNQKNYMLAGFNALMKTFNYRTACCVGEPCISCADGDANELALGMAKAINGDVDKLATASFFVNRIQATVGAEPTAAGNIVVTLAGHPTTVAIVDADTVTTAAAKIVAAVNADADALVTGTSALGVMSFYPKAFVVGSTQTLVYTTPVAGMTITTIVPAAKVLVADAAAAASFIAAVPGVALGIRITGNTDPAPKFNGNVPIKYDANRGHEILVALIDGFNCNGVVTTIQNLRYEEGAGEDVFLEEYMAGGFNGRPGPYRISSVTGLERGNTDHFASKTAKYSKVTLTYNQESYAGWGEYKNDLETIVAIPCADATTIASLATMFDAIFTQFGAMTNDLTGWDCTNVSVNAINDVTADGIELLS
jgi:hypothetical protein